MERIRFRVTKSVALSNGLTLRPGTVYEVNWVSDYSGGAWHYHDKYGETWLIGHCVLGDMDIKPE